MLINEKVIRLFARSILFENAESVNISEAMYSPSAGGIGTGANDLYKIPPAVGPKYMKKWQNDDNDVVNVNNKSTNRLNYNDDFEQENFVNLPDFKKKVSKKIDDIGLDASNEELDSAYKKIEKIIGDML